MGFADPCIALEPRQVGKYIHGGRSRNYKVYPDKPNKPTGCSDLAVHKYRFVFGEKCLSPGKRDGNEGKFGRFREDKGEYFVEDHVEVSYSKRSKKLFWRACHNLLPTKDNLLKQKVVNEPLCPIFEKEPEMVFHALWGCPTAMDVWGE